MAIMKKVLRLKKPFLLNLHCQLFSGQTMTVLYKGHDVDIYDKIMNHHQVKHMLRFGLGKIKEILLPCLFLEFSCILL